MSCELVTSRVGGPVDGACGVSHLKPHPSSLTPVYKYFPNSVINSETVNGLPWTLLNAFASTR